MMQQGLFGDQPIAAAKAVREQKPTTQFQHTWFFGLRPAKDDSQRIYDFADHLLIANGVTGKRISPERLHITLEFIGHDVGPEIVDLACRAADSVRVPAFDACFDSIMSFSGSSHAVVLVGTDGVAGVHNLRTQLACAMANVGFKPRRGYEPHMTLCYDENHRLPQMPIQPIGFPAIEFALIRSHKGLSRHEVVRTWPLPVNGVA